MSVTRGTGRPAGYFIAEGQRVPSVTTIIGRFKDPGGLFRWHHANGAAGLPFGGTSDQAISVGRQVHEMVESFLHGEEPAKPSSLEAIAAYSSWLEWWEGQRFTVEATEMALVSEEHAFGGTIDLILRDSQGRLCIGDLKTSTGIYADYLLQLSAYGLLWDETQEEKIAGGFHLMRFSKEEGDVEYRYFRSLSQEMALFLLCREAYELDKAARKRAR